MAGLRIAIILGSTRPGRRGRAVADWVIDQSAYRTNASYELIDLLDFPLPHFDEVLPPVLGHYGGHHTKQWAAKIDQFDGFIFVTPEYNRSTSAVLKNAIDYIYREWNNKAAAYVSYGALGGARAIEQLRAISAELQLAGVRQQLNFSLFTDFEDGTFRPNPHHATAASIMFDQLEAWAEALRALR